MDVAVKYSESILPIVSVLKVLGLSKSSFYYKPVLDSGKQKGKPFSAFTKTTDGRLVANDKVVDEIKELLAQEFVDYGYLKVTYYLRHELNYIINPKKVYNLMKINRLLNNAPIHSSKLRREWVKELVPKPELDFSYLEFDIKYFYVHKKRRNALVLTVIDVKSRWVLGQLTAWKIREKQVKELFEEIFCKYDLPQKIHVRNDNGSQFVAHSIQKYFADKKQPTVIQEFTKPATPQQNAHIESYHSITERVICQKYQFDDIKELEETLERFKYFYNFKRIHSGVGYTSPFKYLFEKGIDMNANPSQKSYCVPKAS
jgi:putative transposase